MRCKACDRVLTDREMRYMDPNTDEPLDLCSGCKPTYTEALNVDSPYRDAREYVHGSTTMNTIFIVPDED